MELLLDRVREHEGDHPRAMHAIRAPRGGHRAVWRVHRRRGRRSDRGQGGGDNVGGDTLTSARASRASKKKKRKKRAAFRVHSTTLRGRRVCRPTSSTSSFDDAACGGWWRRGRTGELEIYVGGDAALYGWRVVAARAVAARRLSIIIVRAVPALANAAGELRVTPQLLEHHPDVRQ